MLEQDTIYALATPSGSGAIGVIRISGPEAITICRGIFTGKDLEKQKGQSLLFGSIQDGDETIDEVLLSLFKAPHSYTGEHLVEISCHGSPYVLQKLMQLLMQKGARLANPGEFTMRAFRNGKMLYSIRMDILLVVGNTIKKKEETHKMAEANKAFAHYRY